MGDVEEDDLAGILVSCFFILLRSVYIYFWHDSFLS